MHETSSVETMIAGLRVGVTQSAQDSGMAKLTRLHREVVRGMPQMLEQDVRVLLATLFPGDVTRHHTYRRPVTVFVTEGTFKLGPVEVQGSSVGWCLIQGP